MNYEEENEELTSNILNRTFLSNAENFDKIELFVRADCNLRCRYCYLHHHGDDLYPEFNYQTVLMNLDKVTSWMIENEYAPREIEIFSGEPFASKTGFKVIHNLLEAFRRIRIHPSRITIPTNYTFLLSKKQTRKVEELLRKSREYDIPIALSASIDGKYCEANRPFASGASDPRDDAYYDKVFRFNKYWGFSFHPMIHSRLIENWKKNFLWFQKNYKKYGIPFERLYLLEVRNAEWDEESISHLKSFMEFLVRWTFERTGSVSGLEEFIYEHRGFNILASPFSTTGRGIGCSIQSTLCLRLQDLNIFPCHRTAYPEFKTGEFSKEKGFHITNPELFVGILMADTRSFPRCEKCEIRNLCSSGCLGSQYETTGDPFSPIPTVCEMEKAKIAGIVSGLKAVGAYSAIASRASTISEV